MPSLLFADDVNLIALSSTRMNYLLALLDVFCGAFGMRVNVPKCELLVFHPVPAFRQACAAADHVRFKGVAMPVTQRARYLGLFYGPPASRRASDALSLFTGSHVELLAAGRRAVHLLRAKLAAHGLAIPYTAMTLFNTCIRNVLCFGAQVWSTPFLTSDFDQAMKHPMVAEQRLYMQRLVGAQRPNSRALYMELSELPLQHHWAALVFRFWNSMVGSSDSLCHSAFRSDIRMAFAHGFGWTHDVLRFLAELHYEDLLPCVAPVDPDTINSFVEYYSAMELPVEALLQTLADRLLGAQHDSDLAAADPRSYRGAAGPMMCRYVQWMHHSDPADQAANGRWAPLPHTMLSMRHDWHVCLMRFRLGVWGLANNRVLQGTLRMERVCMHCVDAGLGHPIEDELHVCLECPAFSELRTAFANRIPFQDGMRAVMCCRNQKALAQFLYRLHASSEQVHDQAINDLVCDVCGDSGDEAHMLICSGRCARGFHMHCHVPPVPRPPRLWAAWFCSCCAAAREHGYT